MAPRLDLALPTDVFIDWFDTTVTATQIQNNTVLGSADDRDSLTSMLEDAESEFIDLTNAAVRPSREGTPGDVETFEQQTFSPPGHEAFKNQWSGSAQVYQPQEAELNLEHNRVLPFDPDEGDEVRVYRGMDPATDTQWDDITDDEGDLWTMLDHREGVLAVHPIEIFRAMMGTTSRGLSVRTTRRDVRVTLTYRYGALGGSRSNAGETTLGGSGEVLTASDTPDALDVADASRLPRSECVVMIDEEYLHVTPDPDADTLDVHERGVRNTNAESHDADAKVKYTPPSIRKAVAARAGMSVINAGRYQSFLPDSDDEVDKNDMNDRMEATWNRTIEALS